VICFLIGFPVHATFSFGKYCSASGYESAIDFAKQQGQTLIDQRKGRLDITSDSGFENTDSGGNFDGASSMEEYSADPTSFSGSF